MTDALGRAVETLLRKTAEHVVMPRYRNLREGEVIEKAADDLVTVADREAEAVLAEGLARILPEAQIVGEEAAHADPSTLAGLDSLCWIIDPIDGTSNFARGQGHFALMIALADGGETQASWIYNPLRPRMLYAGSGTGAFSDGEPVFARATGENPPILSLMSRFMSEAQRNVVQDAVLPYVRQVEGPGCAAEEYPRTATGGCDAALYQRTLAWDHAAGALWLNEAGGMARRIDGSPYRVNDGRFGMLAAASPALWQDLAGRLIAAGYDRI